MIINKTMAQTNPESKPLPASLNATLNLLCSSISPVEILRTDTASDCVPEFPDIPLIIGINALIMQLVIMLLQNYQNSSGNHA